MKHIFLCVTVLFSCFLVSCERDFEPESSGNIPADSPAVSVGNAKWVRTVYSANKTFYVFFLSPKMLEDGINNLQAVIYLENMKTVTGYRIEIDPRMPDMENHSSPNNKPLEWNAGKNIYEGVLNLTMTGWWRLNLKVYDENNSLIGGSKVDGQSSSMLYWDVDI
ncbi:MAG: FixH family protein [Dysgonamonadaceae bacterium]|jgi:hypothetical protein|nr:FixH family protein [Dysgonamonadaceae bacterium]